MTGMFQQFREEEPGNVLGAVVDRIPIKTDSRWNLFIGVEAAVVVIFSVYISQLLGIPQVGLVSVALASAAIVPRINQILKLNRERIWTYQVSGWLTNRKSILSATSIFSGMFLGFLLVGIFTDRAILNENFQFILEKGALDSTPQIIPERFNVGPGIFFHNVAVMGSFFVLSFAFRGLGASLALGWNAGVWSILLLLGVKGGSEEAANPLIYLLVVLAALTPHVIIEAIGYLSGSLSAIFLSRGLTLYAGNDARLGRVIMAVTVLLVVSIGILAFGAIVESNYAPLVLKYR